MKVCTKCGVEKLRSEFHRSRRNKDGIISQCKPCKNTIIKFWEMLNPDKKREYALSHYYKYHEQKKTKAREYKAKNKDKLKKNMKQWRENNQEYRKQYYEENKEWFKTWNANRRAKLLRAAVSWSDPKKIKAIYDRAVQLTKETGIEHHVDHIIPLNSKYVCGLHNEHNLQILTWFENTTKSNKFTPG